MESVSQVLDRAIIQRVSRRTLASSCRELSVLLDVGIPLLRALQLLSARLTNPVMARVLSEVAGSIEKGNTLAAALSNHPRIFSGLFISVVRVGEVSGNLNEALRRLADLLERDVSIRRRIAFAMLYPAVVLTACVAVVLVILGVVIPQFARIYSEQNISLPRSTRAIIGASEFLSGNWFSMLLAVIVLGALFYFYRRLPTGRRRLDRIKLGLPVFGSVYLKVIVVRVTRTFATMVRSGVPLVTSLRVVGQTAGNKVVDEMFQETSGAVERGETLAGSLAAHKILPALVVEMIAVGESAGSLDTVLDRVARAYEEEVNLLLEALTALLEPALILVLGVVCLVLAVGVLYPYWNLAGAGAF
ncbi:type II secretion system F family protein [bacterium]|nr:type II secretion system F family protein [bacterium]